MFDIFVKSQLCAELLNETMTAIVYKKKQKKVWKSTMCKE